MLVLGRLEKARHLICCLRPELVLESKVPLSSDAYTWFGAHDHQKHNAEVAQGKQAGAAFDTLPHLCLFTLRGAATTRLQKEIIPALAAKLESYELLPSSGPRLPSLLGLHAD